MELIIEGIQTAAVIGCNHHERQLSQALEIDLCLGLAKVAGDNITATANYSEVCQLITQLVPTTDFLLLETLAEFLCAAIFKQFVQVEAIELTIGKPEIYNKRARRILVHHTQLRQYLVALALGSNLNNPRQQLITASEFLSEIVSDLRLAPLYQSTPMGFAAQENFYNTVVVGYTSLKPAPLLVACKKIEKLMGKAEQFVNGPRVIDIDIVLFGQQAYEQGFLTIPHPRMQERDFVLRPLAQLAPEWQHPLLGKTVSQLLSELASSACYILE